MKKMLAASAAAILCACAWAAPKAEFVSSEAEQAPDTIASLTFPSYNDKGSDGYTSTWTATKNGEKWTIANFHNNAGKWDYIKCGRKTAASVASITTPVIKGSVDSIQYISPAHKKIDSVFVYVLQEGKETVYPFALKDSINTISFNKAVDASFKLEVYNAKGSENGMTSISHIFVFGKASTEPEIKTVSSLDLGMGWNGPLSDSIEIFTENVDGLVTCTWKSGLTNFAAEAISKSKIKVSLNATSDDILKDTLVLTYGTASVEVAVSGLQLAVSKDGLTPATAMTTDDAAKIASHLANKAYTKDSVYLTGVVDSVKFTTYKKYIVFLAGAEKERLFEIYNAVLPTGIDTILLGDTLVIKTQIKNYNGIVEDNNGKIISRSAYVEPVVPAAPTAITEPRAWDFTKGANYKDAIVVSDTTWTDPASSKGRATYIPALADGAIMASATDTLGLAKGLFFTADASKILVGITGNYFMQVTGTVRVRIPSCGAGDTLVINYCTSSKGKNANIDSENISENLSTTNTGKTEFVVYVKELGDVTLTLNNCVRLYSLQVKPYVAPAEGECKAPVYVQAGINALAKAWNYIITAGEEGETLSVKIGEAEAVAVESGDTIQVQPGVTVLASAVLGENKGSVEFTAPEFNYTEKVSAPANKSIEVSGLCYSIDALDNAGSGNGYAIKMRVNQTIGELTNALVITVKEGFAITGMTLTGKNNFDDGDITLKSFSIDGEDNLVEKEFVLFDAAKTEQVVTFAGVAKKSIVALFGDIQGSAIQYNAGITFTWAFAADVEEAADTVTFQYMGDFNAIESLQSEVAAQSGKRLVNGRLVILSNGRQYNVAGQLVK